MVDQTLYGAGDLVAAASKLEFPAADGVRDIDHPDLTAQHDDFIAGIWKILAEVCGMRDLHDGDVIGPRHQIVGQTLGSVFSNTDAQLGADGDRLRIGGSALDSHGAGRTSFNGTTLSKRVIPRQTFGHR